MQRVIGMRELPAELDTAGKVREVIECLRRAAAGGGGLGPCLTYEYKKSFRGQVTERTAGLETWLLQMISRKCPLGNGMKAMLPSSFSPIQREPSQIAIW